MLDIVLAIRAGHLLAIAHIHRLGALVRRSVVKMARHALYQNEGFFKSALGRFMLAAAQMPLAGHVGMITVRAQKLGNGGRSIVEIPLIPWFVLLAGQDGFGHSAKPDHMIVETSQEHCPAG